MKNPQTRNACAFLPLNISAVDSVICECLSLDLPTVTSFLVRLVASSAMVKASMEN